MSAQHTPWTASRAVNFPRGWVVNRADGSIAAVVGVFGPGTEQDADLIAAAPELLEAAMQAESLIPHLCDLDSSEATAAVVEQLRAAIAKATGEQA